jgi:rod shape-determining protein MreD
MFSSSSKYRAFAPFLSSLVLIILFTTDSNGLFITGFYPSVLAICIFYWVIFARNLMTSLSIFILGIISDFLLTNPIGLSSLALLVAYSLIKDQQDYILKHGFIFIWITFAAFTFVFFSFSWFLFGLYLADFSIQGDALFQYVSTILFFPVFYKGFSFMKRNKKRFGYS